MKKNKKWLWGGLIILLIMVGTFSNTTNLVAACDPTQESCIEDSSQPEPDQSENNFCFTVSSKTCAQSGASCNTPNQPFATLEQCESFKQQQASQGTNSETPKIGCREGQDCVSLTNPLATTDIKQIIGNSIGVIMGIVGSITFVVFVYGGVLWLTSAGNSERIQKGLQAMLWAGIGIIVVFSSYAIITLILTTLQATP
jgi:hypothetical protein